MLAAGIEDIEELKEHEGGEGEREGIGLAVAGQGILKQPQGADHHGDAVEAEERRALQREDLRVLSAGQGPHDAGARRLDAQCHRGRAVHDDIDPEELDRGEGCRHPHQGRRQHRQDGADVGRELKAHEFDDVVEDDAPFLDRSYDGREVVVHQHHGRGLARDGSAGQAHGDTDIRGLHRGRIVHPVAGHGNDMAARLERLDDADLVGRRDPRDDADVLDPPPECRLVHCVEFGAGDDLARQPELASDGLGGELVVARNHLHLNAGLPTAGNGLGGLRARRVHQTGEPQEGPALGPSPQIVRGLEITGRDGPSCHGKYPQRLAREVLVLGLDALAGRSVEWLLAACAQPVRGAGEQDVRSPFDEQLDLITGVVKGRHELVGRVEGDLGDPRALSLLGFRVETGLACENPEGALGGVPDQLAVAHARLVAERHGAA